MNVRSADLPNYSLYQLASAYRRSGYLFAAIDAYRQLVKQLDPTDAKALSQVLWELGTACLDFNELKAAISVLRNASDAAEESGNHLLEAKCLVALGQAYIETQQAEQGTASLKQARLLLENLKPEGDPL